MVPQVNVELVNAGKYFTANFALPQVRIFLAELELELAALLEVAGGDLVAAEEFPTGRAGVLQPGLYAGVSLLVQGQRVSPLRGEGAVLEGALEDDLRLVDSLVSLQVTGGGERFLTAGADIVLGLGVEQEMFPQIILAGGGVGTSSHLAAKNTFGVSHRVRLTADYHRLEMK